MYAAYDRYKHVEDGDNADYYPALASVPRDLFGICVAGTDGAVYAVGDADYPFTIMSVSKPFVFALVCQEIGPEEARAKLGVNATGLPFNSIMAVELSAERLTNPMVNPARSRRPVSRRGDRGGEVAVHPRRAVAVRGPEADCERRGLCVGVGNESPQSGHRRACCRATAGSISTRSRRPICIPRQCSLDVTAKDLAVMAATLANGGVNPVTGETVVDADSARRVLAVMATAGLYETSGDWLYDVGLPGKSGVGGGIVTVAPGKGGLGAFAPPLDSRRQQRQWTTRRQVSVRATRNEPICFAPGQSVASSTAMEQEECGWVAHLTARSKSGSIRYVRIDTQSR